MSFDWEKYLDLAEDILSSEGDEQARFRICISRSYYGCCNQVKRRSPHREEMTPDSHGNVIRFYKRHPSGNKKLKDIGFDLEALRKIRNEADYNPDIEFTEGKAKEALNKAKEIASFIKRN